MSRFMMSSWWALMGKCIAGHYTKNVVVLHSPLVCFGACFSGTEQPPCEHLAECMLEYGFTLRMFRGRMRWRKKK
jgi:hypothetical protein